MPASLSPSSAAAASNLESEEAEACSSPLQTSQQPSSEQQPAAKKAKTDVNNDAAADADTNNAADNNDGDNDDLSELCWKVWGLFSSYLEEQDDDKSTNSEDTTTKNNDNDNDNDTSGSATKDNDDSESSSSKNNEALLQEILELLLAAQQVTVDPYRNVSLSSIQTVADMLPILLSVVYCCKAEHGLSKYYELLDNGRDNSNNNTRATDAATSSTEMLLKTCQGCLEQSLRYFPSNASTLSLAANLERVTNSKSINAGANSNNNNNNCFGYPKAATAATEVRQQALQFLKKEDDNDTDVQQTLMEYNPVKEWMEVLVLNQIVGVEYTVDGDDDNDDGDDAADNGDDNDASNDHTSKQSATPSAAETEDNQKGEEDEKQSQEHDKDDADDDMKGEDQQQSQEEEEDGGYFTASKVEATCRFMSAMLLSREGRHDAALVHLRAFSGLTHRLHPRVWSNATSTSISTSSSCTTATGTSTVKQQQQQQQPCTGTMAPVSYRGDATTGNGVLPPRLYKRICEVFKPGAAFWKECDYANRGYFSFFSNITKPQDDNNSNNNEGDDEFYDPTDLIDDIVLNHLLPLAKQTLLRQRNAAGKDSKSNNDVEICAYEWWTHSRSNDANLGHMMHFDTDEADLEGKKEQDLHHPILSSVLHLTGDASSSGATIVLDQTPHSEQVAPVCWRSVPQDNTFMIFPGNLLHGVLPCPGRQQQPRQPPSIRRSDDPYRLTFMVGWKTRHVPDQRKDNDSLYGPCAPLPPKDKASWVQEIHEGYDGNTAGSTTSTKPRQRKTGKTEAFAELPSVSPAWEEIQQSPPIVDNAVMIEPLLELPSSLDRRFFVSGAPQCFRESLFEDDDT